MTQLVPGDAAPAFSLQDDGGKTVSNETMRGQRYVLYFYPKDETGGCIKEACAFNDNFSLFEKAKVPVIGVSPDDAASHQAFRAHYGLKFTLLSDPEKKSLESYGAWGERPGRGIGVIRSTFIVGGDGRVQRSWYGVTPEGHATEVLAALER